MLDTYDIHHTIEENIHIECVDDYQLKQYRHRFICFKSWIEHLEYVESIVQVNDKLKVFGLINLRIKEKQDIWTTSEDYLTWIRSGIEALTWARDQL